MKVSTGFFERTSILKAALPIVALTGLLAGCAWTEEAAPRPVAQAPAAQTREEALAAFNANDGIPEDDDLQNDTNAPYQARKVADLPDSRVDESSGIAASRRYPGYLWTHNDSGDKARAFLLTPKGNTAAEIDFKGVVAIDWEDMAVAGQADKAYVYLADIGDNLRARSLIKVYRFAESAIPLTPADLAKSVAEAKTDAQAPVIEINAETITLLYPDGSHDAETLIATPDGRLLVVTKDDTHSPVYVTPGPVKDGYREVMKKVGDLKLGGLSLWSRLITGGDLSPDGTRLVLRTYTHAHEWQLDKPFAIEGDWSQKPPVSWVLPQTRQGEAICYDAAGKSLFITSEKLPAPLFELVPNSKTAEAVAPVKH